MTNKHVYGIMCVLSGFILSLPIIAAIETGYGGITLLCVPLLIFTGVIIDFGGRIRGD